ncbi:GIY-YIG nuclease family protein [Paracoccus yeei]|jgi:hypothetical protein|uniref:GIY-YIG nuclease family protein n=1 Tax=Paracoccus yeei TaxID=147645 RepID=UPI003BF8C766
MGKGRSVRLYLVEGMATGLLTAEIINWTGHALAGPRTRLEGALQRDELTRTGVYLLYGEGLVDDLPSVYVGEGDNIATRLRAHSKDDNKDYWDRFVAITSKDMNLTKAHVRYLEGRLIVLLAEARKCMIRNKTEPVFERLPEADISDMETFLDEIQLLLPVIGVDFLRRPQVKERPETSTDTSVQFSLSNHNKGIVAKAVEEDGEFIVLAGSTGSLNTAPSFSDRVRLVRDQALESGRAIQVDDQTFRVEEDIAFSSPSSASVFLHGTSRNGRTDWLVVGTGETYASFKDRQI